MFAPVVPMGGVAGLRFLDATAPAQRAAFEKSPLLAREIAYFKQTIGEIAAAEELVADRTLLKVALGAFGLDEEMPKRAFLRQILEGGSEDPKALANRFVDPRYAEFARAFGFGDLLGARTADPGFGDKIVAAYKERQFEVSLGQSNDDMRLALNFRREIAEVAASGGSAQTMWFQILGNQPLRAVVEQALNLPTQFSGIDIDKQVETLQTRTRAVFGDDSPTVFADPEVQEQMLNRFLARSQLNQGPAPGTPGLGALTLLQNAALGSAGLQNLILSGLR